MRKNPALWIRIDASAPDDPKVDLIASALGITSSHAFGLCAAVWCRTATICPEGVLGGVPPTTVERWAGWKGKRGRFAEQFLKQFADETGLIKGWKDRQGKLIERSERNREQSDRAREKAKTAVATNGNGAHGASTVLAKYEETERNGTRRNGTEQKAEQKQPAASAAAGSSQKQKQPRIEAEPYIAAWREQYGGKMPYFKQAYSLRQLEAVHGPEETLRRFKIMLASKRAEFASSQHLLEAWGQYGPDGAGTGLRRKALAIYETMRKHSIATCSPPALVNHLERLKAEGAIESVEKWRTLLRTLDMDTIRNARESRWAVQHIEERAGALLLGG